MVTVLVSWVGPISVETVDSPGRSRKQSAFFISFQDLFLRPTESCDKWDAMYAKYEKTVEDVAPTK